MSKVVKKITKPISKVFDKIIPNEIKPLLPYAAAFVPMLAPTSGFMGSMMGRALLSGGANAAAQLAQEGNEGDLNYLSTLMASGIGALSAPGSGDALRGGMTEIPGPGSTGTAGGELGFFDSAKNSGLEFLAKGSDKLQALNAAGAADPFSMAGLKAASIPFAQGTGDLMYQEGVNAMRDYEIALADYERNLAEGEEATNAGRRQAIIDAMTGNHSQQVIDDTLEELGLRNGGRVGLAFGGIPAAVQNVKDKQLTSNLETAQGMEMPIEDLVQEFIELKKRKPNDYDELMDFYRQKYGTGSQISSMTEEMTEEFAANGGIMNGYNMGGSVLPNGIEMDYRGGGFIPMGSKERADDVPARVSKNEFVMTADAVRAAGGGSVNKGAKKMYELMNNLEARV